MAQATSVTFTNQGTMTLSGGTIASDGYLGYTLNNTGTINNTSGDLYLSDSYAWNGSSYVGDALTNTGTIENLSAGSVYSYLSIGGGTNNVVTNAGTIETSTTGSYSSTMNVGSGSGSTVYNTGTIEASQTGTGSAYAYVGNASGTTVTNSGLLEAYGPNASLYLGYDGTYSSSSWANSNGTITAANGGTVYLGGTFSNANLTQGTINGMGGTLNLVGTLNNSGTLAPPDGNGGIFTLYGGTISGGTVDGTNGALTFSNYGGTLSGVTVIDTVSVPQNAGFTLTNGTTFSGNVSFGGNNTVYLGQALTIGTGLIWSDTGYLDMLANAASVTFTNQGTMTLSGGTIASDGYLGYALNNTGTISNTGGDLYLSDSYAWNGSSYVGDALTNTGTIENLSTGSVYSYLSIGGGTNNVVTNAGTIETSTTGSYSSTMNVGSGSGNTVYNTGTIEASQTGTGSAYAYVGNASGTTVTNSGLLEAYGPNASLYLGYDGTYSSSSWANSNGVINGTITATNGGTVYLGGTFSNANLTQGTINGMGGTLNLVGTLNNSGTLAPPDGNGGIFTLYGGTISGGTVDGTNGALTFSNYGGTLSGVTVIDTVSVPQSAGFTLTNGTTFSGNVSFGGNNTVYLGQALTIGPGLTWSDTGYLQMLASATNVTFTNQGTMTLSGGTIASDGYLGYALNNTGTINNTGGDLYLSDSTTEYWNGSEWVYSGDAFTNNGTVEQTGSGYLYVGSTYGTITNLASNTLTGGSWIASGGGSIYLQSTTPISTIASGTTVVLSGSGSNIYTYSGSGPSYQTIDQTLATNSGTFEVLANRNFSSTGAIVNNGTIQLGGGTFSAASLANSAGSAVEGSGTFAPTGGVSIGNGVLVSPGAATAGSYVATLSFNSLTLGGGGQGTFDIENASGAAGVGYDTINVSGNLTITATSGSPFTLNVESINPGTGTPGAATFNSAQSYQWTLLSAPSIAGFSATDFSINSASFANSLGTGAFFVSADSSDIYLNFTPVPEPSTWALLGAGLGTLGAASLVRRRASLRLNRCPEET